MKTFKTWKKEMNEDTQTQLVDLQTKLKQLKTKLKATTDENIKDQIEKQIADLNDQKTKLLDL